MKYLNVYLVVVGTWMWVVRVMSVQIWFGYMYKIQCSVKMKYNVYLVVVETWMWVVRVTSVEVVFAQCGNPGFRIRNWCISSNHKMGKHGMIQF
jgi:hypothetical protein